MYKRLDKVWDTVNDIVYPLVICTQDGKSCWLITKKDNGKINVKTSLWHGKKQNIEGQTGENWDRFSESWFYNYYLFEPKSKESMIIDKIKYLDKRYDELRSKKGTVS